MKKNDEDILEKDDADILQVKLSLDNRKILMKPRMQIKNHTLHQDLLNRIEPFDNFKLNELSSLTEIIPDIIKILEKGIIHKKETEINILKDFVKFNPVYIAILEKYGINVFSDIVKKFRLINFDQGDLIIKFSTSNAVGSSDCYYLILDGEVLINSPVSREVAFKSTDDYEAYKVKNKEILVQRRKFHQTDGDLLRVKVSLLEETAILKPLDGFGDFLLHSRRIIPGAFIAKTKVKILAIHKVDYNPILKSLILAKVHENIKALVNIPFFLNFKSVILYRIASNVKEINFVRNQFVYHEGDEARIIFIVKSGEFRMLKQLIIIKTENNEKLIKLKTTSKASEKAIDKINKESKYPKASPQKMTENKAQLISNHIIKILVHNDLFGYEDALSSNLTKRQSRLCSVQCNSENGVLYSINNELFKDLTNDNDCILRLAKDVRKGEEMILERINEIFQYFPFAFPFQPEKKSTLTSSQNLKLIRAKFETMRDNDIKINNEIQAQNFQLFKGQSIERITSKGSKIDEYKNMLEQCEERNKSILNKFYSVDEDISLPDLNPIINTSSKMKILNSTTKKNWNLNKNSFSSKTLNKYEALSFSRPFQSNLDKSIKLLSQFPLVSSNEYNKFSKTFMNGLNISSARDSNFENNLLSTKLLEKDQPASKMYITNYINQFLKELEESRKRMKIKPFNLTNNYNANQFRSILNGNAHLLNMNSSINYLHRRNNKYFVKSKHNLFRLCK